MKTRYSMLLFTLAALLVTTGCIEKSPIIYSPLKDNYQSSSDTSVKKRLDALLKEDERLYKELAKQTTVIENAEDDDEGEKVNYQEKLTETYNETIEESSDVEWFEKGRQAVIAEKWNEALNAFNKAIKLNPKNTEAYFNRGSAHDELGNYEQAIVDYNKAIKLNPIYIDAYLNRGFAYNNLGKINKAIADIKKAARLGNNFAQKFLKRNGIQW